MFVTQSTFSDDELLLISCIIIEKHYSLRKIESILSQQGQRIPKSTLHKELHKRMPLIDVYLYRQLKNTLKNNFESKHIRGGLATKKKFLKS